MGVITAQDVASKHRYLAHARPEWSASMSQIVNQGGPWKCRSCGTASLLCYRCSACGRDLSGETTTHGRQG